MKNNLVKAAVYGLAAGIICSTVIISIILAKIGLDDYSFKKWVGKSSTENLIILNRDCPDQKNSRYVCMFAAVKAKRSEPLFTEGISTCCALALDNEKEGTHYLAHFAAVNDWEEVRDSITNNFLDTNGLVVYVIAGDMANSKMQAIKNVYKALKGLNLANNAKYCQSDAVLIKEGELYNANF